MDHDEHSDDDQDQGYEGHNPRRLILEPAIRNVVSALGGVEQGVYRFGDECYGCLKDLKKLWRKDDTDDDRTVARIFHELCVLPNELVPILLATAGAGALEDKRAVAAADLVCALTWPIDMAAELKEIEEEDTSASPPDFTQLLASHREYKRALLRPGVLQALFSLTLPCLGRAPVQDRRRRDLVAQAERDGQIVRLVLHIVRNLAFVRDPPAAPGASADAAERAALQGRLVRALEETHFFDLMLTIAANTATDARFADWNVTVLEILYLLLRGVQPESLAVSAAKQPAQKLHSLLALEDQRRRDVARAASSRHSRFGTTISVSLPKTASSSAAPAAGGPNVHVVGAPADDAARAPQLVLHRQRAITQPGRDVLDLSSGKKARAGRAKKADDVGAAGREDVLGLEARRALRAFVAEFLRVGFNPLLASLLKDIKAERAKVAEKDHLRLLYVCKWCLAFARLSRAAAPGTDDSLDLPFGAVAEVTEHLWISWVLRRMREAVEQKPKAWNELQTGLECLTELVLLIEGMGAAAAAGAPLRGADDADALAETADVLQQQLVYNGEVLELALAALRAYRPGTQALAYLDGAVHLGYALLRMLEKCASGAGKALVVRRRRARRRAKKAAPEKAKTSVEEGEGVPDPAKDAEPGLEDLDEEELLALQEEEQEREDQMREALFTFEAFELRFANADVTTTLLAYLARYKEFGHAHEKMKRVVGLLYRQAVKAKAEGLLFTVSALDLFRSILADARTLPKDQAYKDLLSLVNFVLRRFFKAVERAPLLLVEAFFPKNKLSWREYSSLTPEELAKKTGKAPKADGTVEDRRFPPDVRLKKAAESEYTWSEQVGIAIKALVDGEKKNLVEWTKDLLMIVFGQRQRIADEVDGSATERAEAPLDDDDMENDEGLEAAQAKRMSGPSQEAQDRFQDYSIPYTTDEQGEGATKNPHLKLLFRMLKFELVNEDADEFVWSVPKTVMPEFLQSAYNVVNQFLAAPIFLGDGKTLKDVLQNQRRRRRRVRVEAEDSGLSDADDGATFDPEEREARERKKAERQKRREAKDAQKKQKKRKEEAIYKSAEMIVDSDDAAGMNDDAAFWEREARLRARTAVADGSGGGQPLMKATGTRKRKKPAEPGKGKDRKKKRGAATPPPGEDEEAASDAPGADDDNLFGSPAASRAASEVPTTPPSDAEEDDAPAAPPPRAKPKPRPRPRPAKRAAPARTEEEPSASSRASSRAPSAPPPGEESDDPMGEASVPAAAPPRRNRVVISDDED